MSFILLFSFFISHLSLNFQTSLFSFLSLFSTSSNSAPLSTFSSSSSSSQYLLNPFLLFFTSPQSLYSSPLCYPASSPTLPFPQTPLSPLLPPDTIFIFLHLSLTFLSTSSPPLLPLTPLHLPTPSSKYRPTSEQHNDNFSLSTIAEGSHPNVRKLCDTPPNVPHARALAYYDNIICQVTWFSPLSLSPLFSASPPQTLPGPLTPLSPNAWA